MTWLIAGLVVFFGAHFIPMMPAVAQGLTGRVGENGRKGIVALLSFVGFGLIIFGFGRSNFVAVYDPPAWGRTAAAWLMLPVFALLIAAYAPTNIKRVTRHPMLWATVSWSLAHLVSNGDLASLLLFGSFGAWALADMASANRRGALLQQNAVPIYWDVIALVAGVAIFFAVARFHGLVFGVPAGTLV